MRYVALLRGVNVGGKNTVSMSLLKEALEESGFEKVRSYINSGNIIFDFADEEEELLQKTIHEVIEKEFGLDIPVAVISTADLAEALAHAPSWWDRDIDAKHNALFVISPAKPETVIETVGEAKPEYESIAYYGKVIFWSASLKTFSRTQWSKIVSTTAYNDITIRNANTTRKLLSLVDCP